MERKKFSNHNLIYENILLVINYYNLTYENNLICSFDVFLRTQVKKLSYTQKIRVN